MSQIDTTSYADILSRGIAGGWSQFRQQHAQQQSVELENLRALARQQNEDRQYSLALGDRLERSQRDARERSSLMKLRRALIAQADGGGAAMTPGQEPASFTGTLGGQRQPTSPAAIRAQPTTDWTDTITDTDFADMTPGARAEVTNAMVNRNEAARKRKEQQIAVDELRRSGSLSQLKPETAQKLHDEGYLVGVPLNELPPQMHARLIVEQEQRRPDMLDYLSTIPGGGDISLDQRAQLERLSFPQLEVRYLNRLDADEKAAQRASKLNDVRARPWYQTLPENRKYVIDQDIAAGRDVSMESTETPKPMEDRFTAARAGNVVKRAERKYDELKSIYESLNTAGTDKFGMLPPKPEEFALVRKEAPTEKTMRTHQKVWAWNAMNAASKEIEEAENKQETMLGGGSPPVPEQNIRTMVRELKAQGMTDPAQIKAELAKRGIR